MSFVTTRPEALSTAAADLQAIGSTMATQNAAAAGPTTGVVPAAADEVSALQAGLFAAYGTLYQRISAESDAMQEMFVNTLRSSAQAYDDTEGLNVVAAAPSTSGGLLSALLGLFSGGSASNPLAGAFSNGAVLAAMQGSNIGSAASEFTGLGKGYITANPSTYGWGAHHFTGLPTGALGSVLLGASTSAGTTGAGQVRAEIGHAPSAGMLSVPPSWAAQVAQITQPSVPAGGAFVPPAGTDITASPSGGPVMAIPPGPPSTKPGGRASRFGELRYGIKPTVMRHRKS